jgi:hypothetical protein
MPGKGWVVCVGAVGLVAFGGALGAQGFDAGQFGFGAALGVAVDTGEVDRVEEATVVNGVVRVSKESNTSARVMLETHYLFEANRRKFLAVGDPWNWGWGPFVAIQPGSEDLVENLAGGFLVSFRRCISPGAVVPQAVAAAEDTREGKPAPERKSDDCEGDAAKRRGAFNVGVGVVLDPSAKVLGDGLVANEPLPPGETEIRFKETDQWGVLVLFSFSI